MAKLQQLLAWVALISISLLSCRTNSLIVRRSNSRISSTELHRNFNMPRKDVTKNTKGTQLASEGSNSAAVLDRDPSVVAEEKPINQTFENLQTGFFLVLWYIISAYYNIYNKKALNELSMPWFVATVQMGMGVFIFVPLWMLGIRKAPFENFKEFKELLWHSKSVASFMTLSHIAGVTALGSGAVSFTQVVKAAEPVFTAAISAVTIRQFLPWQSYAALLPVVFGVSLASVSELSFSWFCLAAGVTSNVFAAARSVYGKVQMGTSKKVKILQNISADNYYSILTILSFVMLIPVTMIAEGSQIVPLLQATEGPKSIYGAGLRSAFLSGLMFYLYNELSFRVLNKVNAVSHALANTVKRIVIILSSVIAFRNPMSFNGKLGSTLAIFGVFLYSLSQAKYKK